MNGTRRLLVFTLATSVLGILVARVLPSWRAQSDLPPLWSHSISVFISNFILLTMITAGVAIMRNQFRSHMASSVALGAVLIFGLIAAVLPSGEISAYVGISLLVWTTIFAFGMAIRRAMPLRALFLLHWIGLPLLASGTMLIWGQRWEQGVVEWIYASLEGWYLVGSIFAFYVWALPLRGISRSSAITGLAVSVIASCIYALRGSWVSVASVNGLGITLYLPWYYYAIAIFFIAVTMSFLFSGDQDEQLRAFGLGFVLLAGVLPMNNVAIFAACLGLICCAMSYPLREGTMWDDWKKYFGEPYQAENSGRSTATP